jgi:hypothetical protein
MPAGIVRRHFAGYAKKGKGQGKSGAKPKSIWDANNTQTRSEGDAEARSVFKGNVAPRAVPPPRNPLRSFAIYGGLALACGVIGALLWTLRPPERSYDPDSLSRSMTSGSASGSSQRTTAQMYPGSSEAIRSERSTTGERTDQSFLDTPYRKGSGAAVAGGGSSGGGRQSSSGHSTGGSAKSYGGGDGASVVADRRTNSCVVHSDGAAGFADALSNCIQSEKK